MFPKEMLDCEMVNDESTMEMYLLIKKTNADLKKKKEVLKIREERYLELQRFIHSKRLHGDIQSAEEGLLQMVGGTNQSLEEWTRNHEAFKKLLTDEIDLIFKDPTRIQKAFDTESDGLPEKETELLDLLASKVVES